MTPLRKLELAARLALEDEQQEALRLMVLLELQWIFLLSLAR